jgi:L-alanine-DL-glutamate epimerase-like enolase superfamily enzyme
MKITAIRTIPVTVPRRPRSVPATAYSTVSVAKFVLVVVETDGGIEGYGEASPEYQWTGEDDVTCKHFIDNYLAPVLIGRDPLGVRAAAALMERAISHNWYAKAAIEMALWDIVGKEAGLPLSALWGGKLRDGVKVKFVVSGAPDHAADLASRLVEEGFQYIKIKTGLGLDGDMARVRAVVAAVGRRVPVGIDSNQGWTDGQTRAVLPELEALGLAFIEQPVQRYPRKALAEFRRRSRIPLVVHESLFSLSDAQELLELSAADIWAVTPGTHGGYCATAEILSLAHAAGVPCLIGSTFELGVGSAFSGQIGLSAPAIDGTVPSDLIGPFYYDDILINERFEFIDGAVRPPSGPGLGVTLNWAAIERYRSGA